LVTKITSEIKHKANISQLKKPLRKFRKDNFFKEPIHQK